MSTDASPKSMKPDVRYFPDMGTMARSVAGDIAAILAEAIEDRGRATLVVPGGKTPGAMFEVLCVADIDWGRVTITLSDERWIDADDPASNERLVRQRLLGGNAAAASFVSWRGAGATREEAATVLSRAIGQMLPIDVCVLGLGVDGHVASIIPGAAEYRDLFAWDFENFVKRVDAPGAAGAAERLTMTIAAILAARLVVVLFAGEAKREVFHRALEGAGEGPIVLLCWDKPTPVWVCWCPEDAS